MKTFTVRSSWGRIVVDALTGNVDPAASVYYDDPTHAQGEWPIRNIRRFNVDEWRKTYPDEVLEDSEQDILDFGYWINRTPLPGFIYEPPDADYRCNFRQLARDDPYAHVTVKSWPTGRFTVSFHQPVSTTP